MMNKKNLEPLIKNLLKTINIPNLGRKYQGKVRDYYKIAGNRILITTDRISAFDRVLGLIPYKGQVLNQLSAFWFKKTSDIILNHLITIPHPCVSLVYEAKPYPVEMVVRGYITGVTSTSLWRSYENGERTIYGIKFPEGLSKNQMLPKPIITPTTKAEHGLHDTKLTRDEIITKGLLSANKYKEIEETTLRLFARGSQICQKKGLILVDTKYEFADYKGKLMLIDEIHTPDSSRFWKVSTYHKKFAQGLEPENFDKEFFRIWYANKGYTGDGEPPKMDQKLQQETSLRYIKIFEMITGKKFNPVKYPLEEGIKEAIRKYIS